MSEDPLRLREELAQLKKDIAQAQHIKDAVNTHVEALHKEELGYIGAIPSFKQRAKDAEKDAVESYKLLETVNQKIISAHKELTAIQNEIIEANKHLDDVRKAADSVEKQCFLMKEDVLNRVEDIKRREKAVQDRENNCSNQESFHKKVEFDLDRKEAELKKKEDAHIVSQKQLDNNIELHEKNVSLHNDRVRVLNEQRSSVEEAWKRIDDKMLQADKLMKENIDTKAGLMMQLEQVAKDTEANVVKQKSLDTNIADLKHQENVLKIKELKIKKLAYDAGLQQQLKDLEATVK